MLSALQAEESRPQMEPDLRTQIQEITEFQAGVKEKLGHSNESLNLPIVEDFKVGTEISSNIRNYLK